MKKNLLTTTLSLSILAAFSLGCGMLGSGSVSNQQISDDIIAKGKLTKGASDFDFAARLSSHCFKIKDSKIAEDKAELKIFLTGDEVQSGGKDVKILSSDIDLTYKKVGNKWELEKLDLVSFDAKIISAEKAISEFAPLNRSVCSQFSRPYDSKEKK